MSSAVESWERIWSLASGGQNVAVNPASMRDSAPNGPSAPGLDEALVWLSEGFSEGRSQRMLFLVGGPGAGKSHAARRLAGGLEEVDPRHDGLAHRSYRYSTGGRNLLVVNDATIKASRGGESTLVEDVSSAILQGDHLLACVNRGVIVEEENDQFVHSHHAAEAVLRWLSRGDFPIGVDSEVGIDFALKSGPADSEFGRTGRLETSAGPIDLVCLFLDRSSLLERRPIVSIEQEEASPKIVQARKYEVCEFGRRDQLPSGSVPARVLFDEILELGLDPTAFGVQEWNPVTANLSCISNDRLLDSLLSIIRASEVISGQRFTYRELWGAALRVLVGRLAETCSIEVAQLELEDFRIESDSPIEYFDAMKRLARYRYSEAIFGVDEDDWLSSPICRLTRQANPSRDATPGRLSHDPRTGWAQPVLDAFAATEVGESPLEALLASQFGPDDNFPAAVSAFDHWVDKIFCAARDADELSDTEREASLVWYGGYLLRLYAVANGIPAFRHEVNQWTLLWFSSSNLPDELKQPMHTLLLPRKEPGNPGSSFLLPLFDSRTDPIQGRVTAPKLAMKGSTFEIRPQTSGDEAELILSRMGAEIGRIYCDFQLVREALSCSHDHLGISEYSHLVSPRLERLRAAQLVSGKLNTAEICVVSEQAEYTVSFKEN